MYLLIDLFGAGCLVGLLVILVVYGPETYRYCRDEWRKRPPLDYPVWVYRLRRWWRLSRDQIKLFAMLLLCFAGFLILINLLDALGFNWTDNHYQP